ncbi:MAG TPA: hypothetical protein VH593_18290 [Ktedonobacteraceae bacterium]|jgi:hypothetical protein
MTYGYRTCAEPYQAQTLAQDLWLRPAGCTHEDIERFLDWLYRLFSNLYTSAELRQIIVSDPFDASESPRRMKLVDLADWLEAIVA